MRRQNQLGNGDNRPTRGRGSCDTFLRGRLFCFASANLFDLEEGLISKSSLKFQVRLHSYRSDISKRDLVSSSQKYIYRNSAISFRCATIGGYNNFH